LHSVIYSVIFIIDMRIKIMVSIDKYKDNSKENVIIKNPMSLIVKHM
jgi:hypothetical protein